MKRNILFIIFFLAISHSFSQNDTVLVLVQQNSLGGEIVDTSRHYTIWQKHYAAVTSGKISDVNDQSIGLDSEKIFLKHISKIRFDLTKKEKNRMKALGVLGIAVSTVGAFSLPFIDIYSVPFTISKFISKGPVYRAPRCRLMTLQINNSSHIFQKEKHNALKRFIIFNNLDTVYRFSISVNPVKLIDNTAAFSFEFKNRKKSKVGHEFEAGYIYPSVNIYGFIADRNRTVPNYYYHGYEAGYFLKKYFYSIKSDKIMLNYYGFGLQYENLSFKDKWYHGRDKHHPYDSYLSQEKNVISICIRNGITIRKDESTIEYFFGIGGRLSFNNTVYHYYISHGSNTYYNGPPPQDKPKYDNGMYISPFINFGIKFGLNW